MKLTTRSHYSVKALLDLTFQPDYGPASVNAIAQRQNIPAPFLEKLLIELRRAGLVHSIRGAQGGYQLAHAPADISLGQILAAVGETIGPLPNQIRDAEQAEDWVTLLSGTGSTSSCRMLSIASPWRTSILMPAVGKRQKVPMQILSCRMR